MSAPARPEAPRATEWLVVLAALVLVAFYYLARADTIGVASAGRGWSPLTARPLDPAWHFAVSLLVLGLVPVAAARGLAGLKLRALGLGLGRWRAGLAWLAVGVPLAVLAGKIGAGSAAVRAVYPLDPQVTASGFVRYALTELPYFAAWEILFRGVLLFGLARRVGPGVANAIQTALSVTAHFGRPLPETFAALPAGLLFGRVSLSLGSVWYIAVIHWMVGVSQDWFIVTR